MIQIIIIYINNNIYNDISINKTIINKQDEHINSLLEKYIQKNRDILKR